MSAPVDRRRFLKSTAAAAAAVSLTTPSLRAAGANERITLGVMGVRGRGAALTKRFASLPDVTIAYVCDIDQNVVGDAVKGVEAAQQPSPKVVGDFRRILEDPAVDGLVVATPDHWHAMATIHACQAGKHVYVEKPVSHNVIEGRRMIDAARKHRRAVQVGTQRRSSESLAEMGKQLQGGRIGKVHFARTWITSRRPNIGHKPDEAVPAGVDYDLWLGAAPMRPFNPNHFHYEWHWNWLYGTGELGNNGVHGLDLVRWALDLGQPTSVVSSGGKHFFDDDQMTPDTQLVCYEYPGLTVAWEHRIWSPHGLEGMSFGVEFHGDDGVLTTDGAEWWVTRYKQAKEPAVKSTSYEPKHQQNWLACIRSGERPVADIEIGHNSTLLCHIGNISHRVGRKLAWDGSKEQFVGDDEANALLGREYRAPWTLPTV